MTMRNGSTTLLVAVVSIIEAAMFAGKLEVSEAATCNVTELSSCAGAIFFGQTPSQTCCNKLKEQEPCLCEYKNNPNYKQYVDSPNARTVISSCGVPNPNC